MLDALLASVVRLVGSVEIVSFIARGLRRSRRGLFVLVMDGFISSMFEEWGKRRQEG